jgi:hypothetical protein
MEFNEMINEINAGIVFKSVYDADLEEVGEYFIDSESDAELIKAAKDALNAAKPFPLTGEIRTDATTFVNLLRNTFERNDIQLGIAVVDSENFGNEIHIPIIGKEELFIETMLDYHELAYNGSDFVIQVNVSSENTGTIEFVDLDNYENIKTLIKAIKDN